MGNRNPLKKKLSIETETLRRLRDEEMAQAGGASTPIALTMVSVAVSAQVGTQDSAVKPQTLPESANEICW
jgi:hypothetical protein